MTVVEILFFAGCPAYRRARLRVLKQLAELGLAWEVRMIRIRHLRDAKDRDFHGSPTVRVDGRDIEPAWAARSAEVGLYSRTFQWKKREYDVPPEEMLREFFLANRPPGGPR